MNPGRSEDWKPHGCSCIKCLETQPTLFHIPSYPSNMSGSKNSTQTLPQESIDILLEVISKYPNLVQQARFFQQSIQQSDPVKIILFVIDQYPELRQEVHDRHQALRLEKAQDKFQRQQERLELERLKCLPLEYRQWFHQYGQWLREHASQETITTNQAEQPPSWNVANYTDPPFANHPVQRTLPYAASANQVVNRPTVVDRTQEHPVYQSDSDRVTYDHDWSSSELDQYEQEISYSQPSAPRLGIRREMDGGYSFVKEKHGNGRGHKTTR
jgi:hypothetical protein